MTKKDFIALAEMIRNCRKASPQAFRSGEVAELATFCKNQNPQFNADRWFDFIDGKCTANGKTIRS